MCINFMNVKRCLCLVMLHMYARAIVYLLQNEIKVNQNELKWINSIVIYNDPFGNIIICVVFVWLLHCCFHRNGKLHVCCLKNIFLFPTHFNFNILCEKENKFIIKHTCKYIVFQEFLKYWSIPSPIKIYVIKISIL